MTDPSPPDGKAAPRTVREWMRLRIIPYIQVRHVILFDPQKVREALSRFEREV
jgi:hypothetical protein